MRDVTLKRRYKIEALDGGVGWEMVESLFNMVQARTQKVASATFYFFVTCNKVITLDNQSWINVHVCTIDDWTRVPLPLNWSMWPRVVVPIT